MERLTEYFEGKNTCNASKEVCDKQKANPLDEDCCCHCEINQKMIDTLAEYENTELTPEQIHVMIAMVELKKTNSLNSNDVIAEYVMEKRPEILSSMDFALYKIKKQIGKFSEAISKIAFSKAICALERMVKENG